MESLFFNLKTDKFKVMKIIIKTTNIEPNPAIKEYVDEKIGSIDKFLGNIDRSVTEARVEVGKITRGQQKGEIFRAEVNLTLPGELLRSVAHEEDLRIAIDKVKDELQREIKKYKGKQKARFIRGARRAKKLIRLSPLAWFRREKRNK